MSFDKLTVYLDTLPAQGVPGVDCVVMRKHEVIYRHFAGLADREAERPMTGTERFFLYSATKVITCAAALQLYERGDFLMTDPLYAYIPEFRELWIEETLPNGEKQIVPARRPIRIRDLFTMSSGFDLERRTPELEWLREETEGRMPTLPAVRLMAKKKLCFEPGTRFQYGVSHDILGGLIEVISGKSFGAYLAENIFAPLGMERTGFSSAGTAEVMAQYRRNRATGGVERVSTELAGFTGTAYESGGAGLISSVNDYGRFADAMANGGEGVNGARILSPATIALMAVNHLNGEQMADFARMGWLGYGYGLGVRTLIDPAVGGANSPAGEFGWTGAAGSMSLMDPQSGVSLFYAAHVLNNNDGDIHPRLRNILYGCLT